MPQRWQKNLPILQHRIWCDPALQARLFACVDAREFGAALQDLAQELGLALGQDAVEQALRQGGTATGHKRLAR